MTRSNDVTLPMTGVAAAGVAGNLRGAVAVEPHTLSGHRITHTGPGTSGARSTSELTRTSIAGQLSGPIGVGVAGERPVFDCLLARLQQLRSDVAVVAAPPEDPKAPRDTNGEDGRLTIAGQPVIVQITGLPAEDVFKALSIGVASMSPRCPRPSLCCIERSATRSGPAPRRRATT